MNVIDSSGWIEYFTDNINADFFAPVIEDVENLLIPSICIYEVFKRLVIDLGEESALQAVAVMSQGQIIELSRKTAIDAAKISLDRKLAMADSLILATTFEYNATLWTQDAHFKDIESVNYTEKKG
jgi:toxin FitB